MGQSTSKSSRYESNEAMPPNASTASTTPTQKKPMLVAAIDFGTTYSGYALSYTTDFSRKPTDIQIRQWIGPCSIGYKAPTQVLIETNGQTFKAKAFGYDADNVYANASDEEKASLYLFKRFKMSLDVQIGLNNDTEVKDVKGKSLKAMTVFSLTIGCLMDDLKKMVKKQTGIEYTPSEVLWILTVPAIWDDAAKQFMREAATKAGIPNDRLEIGLEPETAAIFCRLRTPGDCVGRNPILSNLKEGDQYIVLDAGGGTVDCTIHEVVESRTVKEVSAASGGHWGGINVDTKFKAFLEEITGPCLLEEIRKEEYDDEVELFEAFELAKRKMSENKSSRERIHIPLVLFDKICQKSFNKNFAERLKESKFKESEVTLKNDKLWISADLFKTFFTEAIEDITNHVKLLLKNSAVSNCKHILMVGGFSESIMLQEAVKNVCPGRTVIIPVDAGLTIVKGAVVFGHDPSLISRRISKYSYGTDTIEDFREGEHSTRFLRFYCRDIFRPFVLAGETLRVGEPSKPIDVTPFIGFLRPRMTIKLYAMKGAVPKYVTDKGCIPVGEIVVPMGMLHSNKRVQVQLILGGIELKVQCKYMNTGEITYGSINFLG